MTFLNLYYFDKTSDDLPTGVHIRIMETLLDLFGEIFHVAEYQTKLGLAHRLIRGCRCLLFEAIQAVSAVTDARFELTLVQQAGFVCVDQSADATSRCSKLLIYLDHICILFLSSAQAALEFLLESAGILKKLADVGPDSCIQSIQANWFIRANLFTVVPMPIPPGAAIVGIECIIPCESGNSMPIKGVSTTTTFQQPLQQVTWSLLLFSSPFLILHQLFSHSLEQFLSNNRGNRNNDLIFHLAGITRNRAPGLFRPPTARAQSQFPLAYTRFTKDCLTLVRRVNQQFSDCFLAPMTTLGTMDFLLGQSSRHLTQRQTIPTHPFKYSLNHFGLLEIHLVVSFATPFMLANITISIRSTTQNTDRTPSSRMAFSSTTAFHDFRALVLGDHTLHLKQQVFFRTGSDRAIQKDQFYSAAMEFFHQQYLPCVFTSQAIRRVYIKPLEPTCPRSIAQPLQCRTNQCATCIPVINEAQFFIKRQAVSLHALPQIGNLASDRSLLSLLIRRNPGINRSTNRNRLCYLVAHHGLCSLGDMPASIPTIYSSFRFRRCFCGQRLTDHRNHELKGASQHFQLQPTTGKLTPYLQWRPFRSALTIHGLPLQKELPQDSRRAKVTAIAIRIHTGGSIDLAVQLSLSSSRRFLQHWPHRVQCGLGRFAVGAGPETLCLHGCDHLLAAHRGLIAWPERHHPDELSAIQHAYNLKLDRGEPAFYAEYQNEPLPEDQPDEDLLAADQIAAKVNGYARGEVPIGCTHLTMFVDVQAKALFWLVAGWEDDFTGYVIDYGTEPDQKAGYFTLRDIRHTLSSAAPRAGLEGAVYAGLERLVGAAVGREWRRDDGATMRIDRCLIDANWGSSTDVVYQFCRQSGHSAILMPSHGRYVGASSIPYNEYKRKRGDRVGLNWRIPTVTGRRAIRHVVFDTNYWKSFAQARFAVPMGDPGCLSLFGRKPDQHRLLAEHLTSEYRIKTEGRGRTVDEWKLRVDGLDNHWLDGLVGCAVAASMQGIVLFGTDVKSMPRPRVRLSELRGGRRIGG